MSLEQAKASLISTAWYASEGKSLVEKLVSTRRIYSELVDIVGFDRHGDDLILERLERLQKNLPVKEGENHG